MARFFNTSSTVMRVIVSFLLAISLFLAGCASIPLSTALRLSSLEPRTLAQIDPGHVRVRVSVPVGYELNVAASRLTLSLHTPNGQTREEKMGLSLLQVTSENRSAGWFAADVPVSTYDLALTPEGAHQLRDMQRFVLSENPGTFEFGINAPLARTPRDPREMTFWADVKLSAKEQYMPLINGAKVTFEHAAGGS